MEVGNEVRKAAIDAGLTLAQISEQAGMKRTRFSACLNGHKDFNANELSAIGRSAGIPGWELMRRAEENAQEVAA